MIVTVCNKAVYDTHYTIRRMIKSPPSEKAHIDETLQWYMSMREEEWSRSGGNENEENGRIYGRFVRGYLPNTWTSQSLKNYVNIQVLIR